MNIRNLDYIRQKDPRLFEAISDLIQGQRNIAQQVNADPSGEPLPPPAIDSLKVTGANGHFNVAIEHGGEFYRGVRYYVEHADNPQFTNAHTVQMGDSRNTNLFLGNVKRYFRAYAAYPSSKPGAPAYHGGAVEPQAVTGGGIIGGPAMLDSQGSGTGTPGEGLSGPGSLPFRSATGAPPVRGEQTEATGSVRTPSGSTAGLPSGSQTYAAVAGGGGGSAEAGGGAGPMGPPGPPGADGADGVGVPSGGTTGKVLAKGSNADYDTEWISAPSGGAGDPIADGLSVQHDPAPASSQAEDDEFDGASLGAKWTAVTNTAAAVEYNSPWASHVRVKFSGNQQFEIRQAYAPAGDFSLTMAGRFMVTTSYQRIGLIVYDDDESDGIYAMWSWNGQPMGILHAKNAGTWAYNQRTLPSTTAYVPVYVNLTRTGTNWKLSISPDGISWRSAAVYSKALTVHHFHLVLGQSGATDPVFTGIDWVRRDFVTL